MISITKFHGLSIDDFTKKYHKSSKREAERWLALKMIAMEHSIPEVTKIIGRDARTVREWVKNFNTFGEKGIKYNWLFTQIEVKFAKGVLHNV